MFRLPGMLVVLSAITIAAIIASCNDSTKEADQPQVADTKTMSHEEMINRGKYLVTVSCHDCHTTKKFGPNGMSLDSSMLLAGHPENGKNPPIEKKSLQPGNWVSISPDLTTFIGPWGISYSANLTPDTATGIGLLTEAAFIKALRTGKHMGLDEGRPIMPPMPWQFIGTLTDEDLKSMFAYLKSIPPVKNRVPAPIPPQEVEKM